MEKNNKTIGIGVSLPRELLAPLDQMAALDGRTRSGFLSWLIGQAVRERMKKLKK